MEDEDIAPNTYTGTAYPVGMGRKSCQYNYIPVLKYSCTDFLPVQAGSAICIWHDILVFIFCGVIYVGTTCLSMVGLSSSPYVLFV